MVRCSICKETGHSANNCNGQFITEWTENIKRFWIYGHNNSVENDEAVKEWARTFRLTIPIINRLWANLGFIYFEKNWCKVISSSFVQTRFYHLTSPLTIADFRERIINYVRPTEEPIAEAIVELERVEEEDRERELEERMRRRILRQVAYDERERELEQEREREQEREQEQEERMRRMILRQVAYDEREREEEEEKRQQVQRELERLLERALEEDRQRILSKQIKWKMDPLELKYFESTDCPVCMESLTSDKTVALDCRHTCCVVCLKQILKVSNKHNCPTCRADIKSIHFKSTISSENFNTISAQINSLV